MKPVIGLSTALERAQWGPWDTEAHVLARSYADQVQAAGGIAVLLPPDPSAGEDPEPWLDMLDGLIITGPVTENMKLALRKTYDATPAPKLVIAVGACAISGGPYVDHPEQNNGADSVVPVDLYIPGCPPHPMTILDGLLRLLGRIEDGSRRMPKS